MTETQTDPTPEAIRAMEAMIDASKENVAEAATRRELEVEVLTDLATLLEHLATSEDRAPGLTGWVTALIGRAVARMAKGPVVALVAQIEEPAAPFVTLRMMAELVSVK